MELLDSSASIRQAAEAVLASRCRTVFIVGESGVLQGSITEGDLVRGFLSGMNTEASVRHLMNTNPLALDEDVTEEQAQSLMNSSGQSAMPVIDSHRRVVRVVKQTDL